MRADLTGLHLGSYDIHERLGAGGMAVVYRATQQPLGREVALKALLPSLIEDPGFLQRFELEARTLARLDHPNILPIYDFVVTAEVVFPDTPLVDAAHDPLHYSHGLIALGTVTIHGGQVTDYDWT